LKRQGLAITLQNGIGNDLQLASVVGGERVLPGTTTEGATLVRPGVVRHAGRGSIKLPDMAGPRTELLERFVALLRQAGFSVSLTPDVETEIWQKVAINAAINPLTALVGAPNGFLLASGAAKRIAQGAAREAAIVARARGCLIDPAATAQQTMEVARTTGQNLSSMLQDLNNQRPTELDAITGAIIHLGKEANVPTPYNDALYELLTRKLRGEQWPAGIKFLANELQPLFRRLHEEGQNAKM
jgi:2-dehydropantoate 2-reductase